MKYDFNLKILGSVLCRIIKNKSIDNVTLKKVKKEYKEIMQRASDIGNNNNLITSYALAGFFIAMNRITKLTPDENYEILYNGMKNSKLLKTFMGNADSYFSEKKMQFRRKWSEETHKKKYKNDWVVDVIENSDDFVFGFDYTECGVCKLCKDEGCPFLAKYLCRLDFLLVEIIGIKLKRTKTLAEGYDKCDFRFMK